MRALLVVLSLGVALGCASVALAASLGSVSSQSLTAFAAASTVPTSTCTLTPTADSYVDDGNANTNFGGNVNLRVRASVARKMRTFARFNVGCVPANAKIASADLKLYLNTAPGASRTYSASRVTAAWVENSLTWNNQPATTGSVTTGTGTTSGVWLQWNVATDLQAFVNGTATNNGWRVSDTNEGSAGTNTGIFDSREGANHPSLVIAYWP